MDNQINMNGAVSSQTTPGGVGNPAMGGMLNMRYGPGVPVSMAAAMGQLGQMGFPGQPPSAMGNATAMHPGHPTYPHQPQNPQQQQHNPAMLFHQQLMSPGGGGWALHNTASQLSQALGSPPMQANPLMSVAEQQQQQHHQHPKTVPQSQIDANNAIVFAQLSAMASQARQQPQQMQIQIQPQPHSHVQPHPQASVGQPQSQPQPQPQPQQQMMMQHDSYSLLMQQLQQQPEHVRRAAMVAALSTQQHYQQYAMPPPPPVSSLVGQSRVTPHSTPPTASSTPALNSAALPIAQVQPPMKTTSASQQNHPKQQQQQQQPLQGVTISDGPAANGLAGVSAGVVSDNTAANSVNPSLLQSSNMSTEANMAAGGNGNDGRAESTVSSSSPALSTSTRKSRASPKVQPPKKSSKETKRKGGAKKDSKNTPAAAMSKAKAIPAAQADTTVLSTTPSLTAENHKQSQNQTLPQIPTQKVPSAAPSAPKRARSRSVAVAKPVLLAASVRTAAVGSESDSAKHISSEAEQLPPPLIPSHTAPLSAAARAPSVKLSTQPMRAPRSSTVIPLPYAIENMHTEQEILGSGVERLLAFHGDLTDSVRDLEKWNSTVAKHFSSDGTLRLDIGAQSFDIPVSTTGRFYQQLFTEGGVCSMHVALGPAKVHRLRHAASLISFHGVMITSTYLGGRRVIETGSLRVIFTSDFRIRLWAFSAADATICLPRKRPNAQDDAMVRTAESTIGRNLEWPNTSALPAKRRKSAHGRQPPEECVLPPAALRHAEVASTMYALRDLIDVQAQNPSKSAASVLKIWANAENIKVEATSSKSTAPSGERKRPRKRSIQASAAPASIPNPSESERAATAMADKPVVASDKPMHLVAPAATESVP